MRLPLFFLPVVVGLFGLLTVVPSSAADLTPDQIESLRKKLAEIKDNLDGYLSNRNKSARSVFMDASKDPKLALKLYLDCVKKVEYDREGRSESDFRAWKESQEDRLRDKQFIESLLIQLRYLAPELSRRRGGET